MTDYRNAMFNRATPEGRQEGLIVARSDSRVANGTDLRLKWWGECIIILTFYGVYTLVRNQYGSELGLAAKQAAIDNAYSVIKLERAIHLFGEQGIQDLFIDWIWLIRFWNIFYGTCHFAVTISVMVLLYLRCPSRYGKWRTILASTTALALVGFTLFPLMPPRLLNDCGSFGACDQNYHFVDTLRDPGGLWSFGSSAMAEISNQYAAMPSLHIAWAFWCMFAAYPVLRRRWTRLALLCYPWMTIFAVIVTANHYWIDAVGALAVLGVGYLLGTALAKVLPVWLVPPQPQAASVIASNNDSTPSHVALHPARSPVELAHDSYEPNRAPHDSYEPANHSCESPHESFEPNRAALKQPPDSFEMPHDSYEAAHDSYEPNRAPHDSYEVPHDSFEAAPDSAHSKRGLKEVANQDMRKKAANQGSHDET